MKIFGSLVKGLRNGMELLKIIQHEHDFSSFSRMLDLSALSIGGLDEILTQIETALDDDFPAYKVRLGTLLFNNILRILPTLKSITCG